MSEGGSTRWETEMENKQMISGRGLGYWIFDILDLATVVGRDYTLDRLELFRVYNMETRHNTTSKPTLKRGGNYGLRLFSYWEGCRG